MTQLPETPEQTPPPPAQDPEGTEPRAEPTGEPTEAAEAAAEATPPAAGPNPEPSDAELQRRPERRHRPRRGEISPDDPFWTFGSPVESWGSTQRRGAPQGPNQGQARPPRPSRPIRMLECRRCGVKMEWRSVHGDRTQCPMCNQWMRMVEL
jgi:hypothetical protein